MSEMSQRGDIPAAVSLKEPRGLGVTEEAFLLSSVRPALCSVYSEAHSRKNKMTFKIPVPCVPMCKGRSQFVNNVSLCTQTGSSTYILCPKGLNRGRPLTHTLDWTTSGDMATAPWNPGIPNLSSAAMGSSGRCLSAPAADVCSLWKIRPTAAVSPHLTRAARGPFQDLRMKGAVDWMPRP